MANMFMFVSFFVAGIFVLFAEFNDSRKYNINTSWIMLTIGILFTAVGVGGILAIAMEIILWS